MNNTIALLHFDDPNNIVKDEVSKNKWNIIGSGLSINSTNAKFGNALQFNGTESYLQLQGGITLGGGDFTIDWWGVGKGNYNRNSGWWRFFDFNMNKNSESCRVFAGVYAGQSQQMFFNINNTSSSSSSCNLSALHHYALTYNWNLKQYKTYIDGVLKGTFNATLPKSTFTYTLIGMSNHTVDSYLLGTIDEFRVSDCIRWTSNFTPPTQQYIYGPYAEFPSNLDGTYTTAPNKLKYYYKVKFEQGPYTQTSNVVNYETTRILSVLRKILIINILYKYMRSLNF